VVSHCDDLRLELSFELRFTKNTTKLVDTWQHHELTTLCVKLPRLNCNESPRLVQSSQQYRLTVHNPRRMEPRPGLQFTAHDVWSHGPAYSSQPTTYGATARLTVHNPRRMEPRPGLQFTAHDVWSHGPAYSSQPTTYGATARLTVHSPRRMEPRPGWSFWTNRHVNTEHTVCPTAIFASLHTSLHTRFISCRYKCNVAKITTGVYQQGWSVAFIQTFQSHFFHSLEMLTAGKCSTKFHKNYLY
jgi:hypothetical protein